jgi:hypothetical protein
MITPGISPSASQRTWRVTVASGGPMSSCSSADLTLATTYDSEMMTQVTVTDAANSFAKKDCQYILSIDVVAYMTASDQTVVSIDTHPPTVSVLAAELQSNTWVLRSAAGQTLDVSVVAIDADNDLLTYAWSGNAVSLLSCYPNCSTPLVSFRNALSVGIYNLQVDVSDGYEPPASANIQINVSNCLWVAPGATGNGTSPLSPMGMIGNALSQARNLPETDVCLLGNALPCTSTSACTGSTGYCSLNLGKCAFPEALYFPNRNAGAGGSVNLLGGFDASGVLRPSGLRQAVEVNGDTASIIFEAGYNGVIRAVDFSHASAMSPTMPTSVMRVMQASPTLLDCGIFLGTGSMVIGLEVGASDAAGPSATPRMLGGTIQNPVPINGNCIGVLAAQSTVGAVVSITLDGLGFINIGRGGADCTMNAFGITAGGGAKTIIQNIPVIAVQGRGNAVVIDASSGVDLTLVHNGTITAEAVSGSATAIQLAGGVNGQVATGRISGNQAIAAMTSTGQTAVAIRLERTNNLEISGNAKIGDPYLSAGSQVGIGILDGGIDATGNIALGNSTGLRILNNFAISGGTGVANPVDCSGTRVVAGIVLAGTGNGEIIGNGRPNHPEGGIRGGSTVNAWEVGSVGIPPSAVGLWLLGTLNARIKNNEIISGVLFPHWDNNCEQPAGKAMPVAVGYRDGYPSNGGTEPAPSLAYSSGTLADGNGIRCFEQATSGNSGGNGRCYAIEINGSDNIAGGAGITLRNNIVFARGYALAVGLYQHDDAPLFAVNNTFEVALPVFVDPIVPADSLHTLAVVLDHVENGGPTLVNNILYAHTDTRFAGAHVVPLRCYSYESAPTSCNIDALLHNLFYVDGLAGTPNAAYVDLVQASFDTFPLASVVASFGADALNSIPGVAQDLGNFVAAPGLDERDLGWLKSRARLAAGSAAIDHGYAGALVPTTDIDGDPRPFGLAVDIGPDEWLGD